MYTERRSQILAGAVIWRHTPAAGSATAVLPDGCMDLLWAGGRLLVAGPDTRAHPAGEVGGSSFTGVRFAPGTAPRLLGVPAVELRDRRVELGALWPDKAVRAWEQRVEAAPDPAAVLEALAAQRAASSACPDPLAAQVVRCLKAGYSVAATAHRLDVGERSLHRRSLAAFGYGPKTLARVLRLERALALAASGVPDVEVALAVGCADQAHLAREMRALAGMTLGAWRAGLQPAPSTPPSNGPVALAPADSRGAKSETPLPSGSRTTA
ncbi:helix-turn-helix domain-containing protein [Streptomyces sp. NPDC006879]|uniref:helix-turn-helix domain-containing protein n=1 Tax=Streptomyces sp. NPDC006879 TaxID=3364767 RepID=UPI0036A708FC